MRGKLARGCGRGTRGASGENDSGGDRRSARGLLLLLELALEVDNLQRQRESESAPRLFAHRPGESSANETEVDAGTGPTHLHALALDLGLEVLEARLDSGAAGRKAGSAREPWLSRREGEDAHLAGDPLEALVDVVACFRLVLLHEDGADELVDRVVLGEVGELLRARGGEEGEGQLSAGTNASSESESAPS